MFLHVQKGYCCESDQSPEEPFYCEAAGHDVLTDCVCVTGGGVVWRRALEGLLHTNGHRLLLRVETSE